MKKGSLDNRSLLPLAAALMAICLSPLTSRAQFLKDEAPVDKTVTATGKAAGTDDKAVAEATAMALRTAVEQACGVFLTAQSQIQDYKAVYDKVIAKAVGYVRESKVIRTWTENGVTLVRVQARVSTKKFQEDWAAIAHTVQQENNPRVILAIVDTLNDAQPAASGAGQEPARPAGIAQGKFEDFFLSKGIVLVDRDTAAEVTKRDVLLAALKDDDKAVAAIGARFKADVVVVGRANARFGKQLDVGGVQMFQFNAGMTVRVVQSDSARVLASKTFGPISVNALQKGLGEEKALTKLAEDSAPQLLAAVVEAWRQRANVSRTVQLSISGMDYEGWKAFRDEAAKVRGVQNLRLREITEATANIDVEYAFTNENLADRLGEMKTVKLRIGEITANRIIMKLVAVTPPIVIPGAVPPPPPPPMPPAMIVPPPPAPSISAPPASQPAP